MGKWNDPDYVRAYHKQYQTKNKDRLKVQRKLYYKANKRRINRRNKEWRKANKERDIRNKKLHHLKTYGPNTLAIRNSRREENRLRAIKMLGSKCKDCGGVFHPACYDFHHINKENKSFEISDRIRNWTKLLVNELRKCLLLCSNCHRLRHHMEYENAPKKRQK